MSRSTFELIRYIDSYKMDKSNCNDINTEDLRSMEHEKLYNSIHEMIHRIEKQLNDIKKANVLKENEQIKNIRAAVNPHFQFNIFKLCYLDVRR